MGVWKTVSFSAQATLRVQRVGYVLSRHGLLGLVQSLGIEIGRRGFMVVGIQKNTSVPLNAVVGKNLAVTLAELGPTFIKLGQVLASRPDIAGEQISDELKVLLDRVPPLPFKTIHKILTKELGKKKLGQAFQSIESKPMASASLSQIHRAILEDGTPVIIKVQKKNVAQVVRMDLSLLEGLVWPLHLLYPKWNLLQIFGEFKTATLREIDYREEAKNMDRFRKNYRRFFSNPDVVFPSYYPKLTTEKVITMEPLHGKKFTEIKKGSTVARKVASLSLATLFEQIFDHGFFHADPHAGNLFFMEDEGRIGFIDLGLVGHLNPQDKQRFLKVLLALLRKNRTDLAHALFEMGTPHKRTQFDNFEKDIGTLLDQVKLKGTDNLRFDESVQQLLEIARKNRIDIPNRYLMMIRSCLLIEGVAKSLDPSVSILKIAGPIVAKSLAKSYSPVNLIKRVFRG